MEEGAYFAFRTNSQMSLFRIQFKEWPDTVRISPQQDFPFFHVQQTEGENPVQVMGDVVDSSFRVQVQQYLDVATSGIVKIKLFANL